MTGWQPGMPARCTIWRTGARRIGIRTACWTACEASSCLAMNYRTAEPAEPHAGHGRVSRYAWGEADYHDLIHERLDQLGGFLREGVPEARVRGVVDTAPLLEREFAQLAGLGLDWKEHAAAESR